MKIIPAILTSDIEEVREKMQDVELAIPPIGTNLPKVQVDIVDGVFADNKTVTLEALAEVDNCTDLDIHLMVKEPVGWIEKCIEAYSNRIIGQIEMMENQTEFVNKVIEANVLAGLAIDLGTPVSDIDETVFPELDVVLVMAVKAGFQHQQFEEYALDKVRELDEKRKAENLSFKICVDGGVEVSNIKKIAQAGADEAVAGSSLFDGDLEDNLKRFNNEI